MQYSKCLINALLMHIIRSNYRAHFLHDDLKLITWHVHTYTQLCDNGLNFFALNSLPKFFPYTCITMIPIDCKLIFTYISSKHVPQLLI